MCCFYIVIKLLMLEILLAGLTDPITASRYDYGYHPSAEEFDNLLSETRRTWTHTLLKAERDRVLMKPAKANYKAGARYFVPKFHYENSETIKSNGFNKQNAVKNQNSQLASPLKHRKPLQNIGSSLDFNYFSDELPKPLVTTPLNDQINLAAYTTISDVVKLIKPVSPAKPEISLKPLVKPIDIKNHKYSLNNRYNNNNNSHTHLPIYFTNPVTGIVYAITEIGKSSENITKTNGSIPIFITKEQYERDIMQLEKIYKQKCQNFEISTTTRPSLIRLQKPLAPTLPITSTKFSPASVTLKPLKKPSPVIVKTELIVKDKKPAIVKRPLRNKKNKLKSKLKVKKHKPPGHKTLSTTISPVLQNYSAGPKIILGTRTLTGKLHKADEKMSTQLEKPDFDSIFSVSTTATGKTNFHTVNKRSVETRLKIESLKKNYSKPEAIQNLTDTDKISWTNSTPSQYDLLQKNLTSSQYDLLQKNVSHKQNKLNNLSNLAQNLTHVFLKNSPNFAHKNLTKLNIRKTTFNKNNNSDLIIEKSVLNNREPLLNTIHTKPAVRTKNVLTNSSTENITNLKEKSANKSMTFLDLKHRINKRSTEANVAKTNLALEKFLKKSNKTEMEQNNFTAHAMKINKQNSKLPTKIQANITLSTNSTGIKNKKLSESANGELKRLQKIRRLSKVTTNNPKHRKTSARTNKPDIKKKYIKKSPKGKQDTEYYFFDVEENYDDDEDESDEEEEEYVDDDGDEQEEQQAVQDQYDDYKQQNEILAYDDASYQTHTLEAGLSQEDLTEKPTQGSSSSSQQESDNSVSKLEKLDLKTPLLDYDTEGEIAVRPTSTHVKKRYRRRPPKLKIGEDYDDDSYDDDDEDDDENGLSSHLSGFFRMIFYPVQVVMSSVMDSFASKDAADDHDNSNFNTYTQYTPYHKHKTLKQEHSSDEYDEDYDSSPESSGSSLSNWFSSWFAFNRRNKKIGSTTVAPIRRKPVKTSSSWLPSWLPFGANDRISTEAASSEDYDEYDKWFASWFGQMKPRGRKRTTTTTSTTTTQVPNVPILTIVDPMRNPQNWIGILAHHIINHTSTSTANPLKDIWNKVISTTTENPEVPRRVSYDKYQIWRLKPQDDSQVKALEEYKKSEDGIKLQWLKGPSLRGLTDVLVPPKMLVDFQASLTFELIDHEVLIFDVGKAIAYEKSKEDYLFTTTQKPKKHHNKLGSAIATMGWHKYYEYDDIINYLETMRMRFPHLVDLIHIGRSYEGRSLIVMKIESKEAAAVNSAHYNAHHRNKLRHKKRIGLANAVFIEAGTHGMEWIGPATATWIINELLRIIKKNVTDEQNFIRNTTWYIMPVLNPDGYVYSHEFDRFWKKSRSRHISRPSGILNSAMTWLQKKRSKEKTCFGVDLDRNWQYQWGRRGSSKSACNEFYAGPAPFSEPETKALSDFLMDYKTQIKLFVSMQSYGQIISYPYKANTTYDTERLDDLLDVAMVGTDGLRKKGSKSRYKVDASNDLVENRSGCSDAFAAYEAGIPFSYTLQLADNGVHGYLLPSASIESTAKDSFEIISSMLDYI